ncbi:MAG: archaeal proteasome endopeptidase complex subunit alpha [Candidatus Ranarchaeia archaeon]
MMMQQPRLGYDKSAVMYNPDGRIIQVEYAREAVKRGSTSVGIRVKEGVVLCGARISATPLIEPNVKVHKVDEDIGALTTGYIADTRQLISRARVHSQIYRLSYDERPDVIVIAEELGDYIQQHTQYAGLRPFGCALLVGGLSDSTPQLTLLDPGGAVLRCRGIAVGQGEDEAREVLEQGYKEDLPLDKTIALAIKAVAAGMKIKPEEVDVDMGVVITKERKFKFIRDISKYVETIKKDKDKTSTE